VTGVLPFSVPFSVRLFGLFSCRSCFYIGRFGLTFPWSAVTQSTVGVFENAHLANTRQAGFPTRRGDQTTGGTSRRSVEAGLWGCGVSILKSSKPELQCHSRGLDSRHAKDAQKTSKNSSSRCGVVTRAHCGFRALALIRALCSENPSSHQADPAR